MPTTRRRSRRTVVTTTSAASTRATRRISDDETSSGSESDAGAPSPAPSSPRSPRSPRTPRRRRAPASPTTAKTPPHFRHNRLIKSGYSVYGDEAEALATLTEPNNETWNVRVALVCSALFVLLMANTGATAADAGRDNLVFNSAAAAVALAFAVAALAHMFGQIPSKYAVWSCANVVADWAVACSVLVVLHATGYKFTVRCSDDFNRNMLPREHFAIFCLFFGASTAAAAGVLVHARRRFAASSEPLPISRWARVLVYAAPAYALAMLVYGTHGSDAGARNAAALLGAAAAVEAFHIPECFFPPRFFDRGVTSRAWHYALGALGVYALFVNRWQVATGRSDLIWFQVFC